MKRLEPVREFRRLRVAALAFVASQAACATEPLHQDTLVAPDADAPDAAPFHFYLFKNGTPSTANTAVYRLFVDDKLLVADGTYLQLNSSSGVCCPAVPSGQHVFELRDESGARYVATPPLDARAGLLHQLIFFGDGAAPEFRFYVDDPAPVPAGMTHVRLLNATTTRQDLVALRCTDIPAGICASLGTAPVAYGRTFEVDWPRAELAQLQWSVPAVGGPAPPPEQLVTLVPAVALEPLPRAYPDGCVPDHLSAILQVPPTGDYGAGSFDSGLGSYIPFCSGI
jgi:hypothetical protein